MHCPNCKNELPPRFVWTTRMSKATCPSCKVKIIPTKKSLKKAGKKAVPTGLGIGVFLGGGTVYIMFVTDHWLLPLLFFMVPFFLLITICSVYYGKKHMKFERTETSPPNL